MVEADKFALKVNVNSSIYQILNQNFGFYKRNIFIIVFKSDIELSVLSQRQSTVTTIESELGNSFVETGGYITFSFQGEGVYLSWLMCNFLCYESKFWHHKLKSFSKHWVKRLSLPCFSVIKRLNDTHICQDESPYGIIAYRRLSPVFVCSANAFTNSLKGTCWLVQDDW